MPDRPRATNQVLRVGKYCCAGRSVYFGPYGDLVPSGFECYKAREGEGRREKGEEGRGKEKKDGRLGEGPNVTGPVKGPEGKTRKAGASPTVQARRAISQVKAE